VAATTSITSALAMGGSGHAVNANAYGASMLDDVADAVPAYDSGSLFCYRARQRLEKSLLEESTLIAQAQRGEIGAYEELVRRYQEVAVRTAYLISGSAGEAEDVAQEAFVKAYFALSSFRPGAPLRPWLLRIVSNEARNRRRAEGRRAALLTRAATVRPLRAAESSPELLALANEQHRVLMRAVLRLGDDDRLVITYRYFTDLSEAEMAIALACPRGTVKSRLSRALARLRRELAGEEDLAPMSAGASGEDAHG
jgi:RNA polymerase sigma-70 factor (ECF subfamily)